MTEVNEIRIPFSDASRIAITCKHCKAHMILDLGEDKQIGRFLIENEKNDQGFICSCCTTPFDSSIRFAVTHLSRSFDTLKKSGQMFSFCVPNLTR
jgi:hypothetical protein